MWLHSFILVYDITICFVILSMYLTKVSECNPIANLNLSEHIREFASKDDNINSTNVKTLQKVNPKLYTDFVSSRPILFRNAPDSKSSSSSHSRGIINREHPGFTLHDYEEYPQLDYGYEHHIPTSDHHHGYEHHNFNHHQFGHHEGHHYVGHHKYYKHALAAKAVLWPIAGIALLGAAAALVSNPILLQLGVVSGKRKRRNTEEISGPEFSSEVTKWIPQLKRKVVKSESTPTKLSKWLHKKIIDEKEPISKQRIMCKKKILVAKSSAEDSEDRSKEKFDERNFIPVPIKIKHN